MEQLANFFLASHRTCKTDYLEKYRRLIQSVQEEPSKVEPVLKCVSHTSEETSTPVCSKCGAQMIKRRAAKGTNAGNEFWGCSNFPKCREIVNI